MNHPEGDDAVAIGVVNDDFRECEYENFSCTASELDSGNGERRGLLLVVAERGRLFWPKSDILATS